VTYLTAPTINFTIFIAGDIIIAKQVLREYCMETGFCVTIEPTTYIYTGGEEAGIRVGIINYPRFPETEQSLWNRATTIAETLRVRLCQMSYTIVGPTESRYFSAKKVD